MKKLLLSFLISTSSLSYAISIKLVPSEFAGFVHFLYENQDKLLDSKLEELQLEQQDKFTRPQVDLSVLRSNVVVVEQFFYALSSLQAINEAEKWIVTHVKDQQQSQHLLSSIRNLYATYTTRKHHVVNIDEYIQTTHELIQTKASTINSFLENTRAFYSTETMPYDEIIVYVFPLLTNQPNEVYNLYNTILLPVTCEELIKKR